MSDHSNNASGGIGFCGLLTVLFVGLKLTHFIDWSWWWVLSPIWLSVALVLALWICVALVVGVVVAITATFAYFSK